MNDDQLMTVLKSKFPHDIVAVGDDIHYKFDEILLEFKPNETIVKVMSKGKVIHDVKSSGRLKIQDTLSLRFDGTSRVDLTLS